MATLTTGPDDRAAGTIFTAARLRALPFVHAVLLGAVALAFNSESISSINIISCTTWPPPYHIFLLNDLVYTGHLTMPSILVLILNIALIPRRLLSDYVRSAPMLLQTLALVSGLWLLDALLLLHLTPLLSA